MCFTKRFTSRQEAEDNHAQIAEQDIQVYKILFIFPDGELKSPYRGMVYKEGEEYKATMKVRIEDSATKNQVYISINEELHAFINRVKAKTIARHIEERDRIHVTVSKMTVPKGAKYYVDLMHQEIVSDTLAFRLPEGEQLPLITNQ